ncbi:hypothetical protein [Nonomuraea rhodomycinica]|uniref:Uncharacterized protein n=1 Tax=Nonomuraea rhodomycinica TaxID=1712872 RepID=A0A7Y6IT26_9ACTN|nr:hypothetical protein [Nonomuraea rhodomycinica]NUW43889.1 hypothetical protein [Nonomuraea rhodomycinica]
MGAFDELIDSARGARSDRDEGYGIRSAVGNDHAGTLYPAAVAATDVLLAVIADHPGLPRRQPIEVIAAIVERVEGATDALRAVAGRDPHARGLVRELIKAHSQGWTVGG